MQIQLPVQAPKQSPIDVKTRDFHLVEGQKGYAVQLGERVLGFSGDDVATVALRVEDGRLHISLQGDDGVPLREYQIPSTELLHQDVQSLKQAGIYFSPSESEELRNLMRLSMSGSVSRQEILLMLDEISHMAPDLSGTTRIDAGDLYPDLSKQVRQLMGVMPEDIQRYVILSNRDQISDPIWQALYLVSKLDSERYPALARFLAGESSFTYLAAAELREVATLNELQRPHPITNLDATAFRKLIEHLEGIQVHGDARAPIFPQPVARMVFEHFPFQIPDFTAAESFEELEHQLLSRLKGAPNTASMNASLNNLRELLQQRLDVTSYRELADFLNGRPGAPFSTEAREGILHFIKHPPQESARNGMGSIGDGPWLKLQNFLARQTLDLEALPGVAWVGPDRDMGVVDKHLARDFKLLKSNERLALFVLDHLDPVRDSDLFRHFENQNGLSRLTPTLETELRHFLDRGIPPSVQRGLTHFNDQRFQNLAELLKHHAKLEVPHGYLPENPRLRLALADLAEHQTQTEGETKPEDMDLRPRVTSGRHNTRALAQVILEQLQGLSEGDQDLRLTQLLRQNLQNFRHVAVLDQVWKGEELVGGLLGKGQPLAHELRPLQNALRDISALMRGEDGEVDWHHWRQQPVENKTPSGLRLNLEQRMLRDFEGPERYLQIDRQLPERGKNFESQVQDLSWMRRLEELADRLERNGSSGGPRLHNALEKSQRALAELRDLLIHNGQSTWEHHGDSPLTRDKYEQFRQFREAVLAGKGGNTDKLFEGPFLREGFGNAAEQRQQEEMNRLEPLFREAMSRFDREPAKVLDKLLDAMTRPSEMTRGEAGQRVQQLVSNLHDFNQHQNLNQQPMYLSMPLKWGDTQSDMELAYFRLPNSGEKKNRYMVVIHLDFATWGHLRVDALKEGEQLSATFWVATAKMNDHLQKELPTLKSKLRDQGIAEVQLVVKREAKKAESRVSELCLPTHDGNLDLEI